MRAEKRRTKQGSEGSSQSSPQCPQARQPPVAIVGGSYAGLTAALTLKRKSIPFIVFEKRKQPFSHVQGHFSVPSYEAVAKKLEISAFKKSPSREEVIDSFLENVSEQLVCGHVMVSVDSRNGLFYLQSETETGTKQHGPFHTVIGADGVRSTVRRHALRHTYLIGDARWANERSAFDFGLHRIQQGADLALLDGIELGQAIFEHLNERSFPQTNRRYYFSRRLPKAQRPPRPVPICFDKVYHFATESLLLASTERPDWYPVNHVCCYGNGHLLWDHTEKEVDNGSIALLGSSHTFLGGSTILFDQRIPCLQQGGARCLRYDPNTVAIS
ncbi:hypothetical protein THAOC_11254, partial [Thalassiosira oceanica]